MFGRVAVEVAALLATATAAARARPSGVEVGRLVLLAGRALGYTEMIRRSERVRRRHASMLRVDMDSTWLFAAALLLPTALATVLMGVIYVRRRIRASGPVPHWRVFTAGTVVLVVHMVSAVLAVTGHAGGQPGGVPRGMAGLVVLLTALGAYLTVGTLLVAGAAALVTGASLTRCLPGDADSNLLEVAALGLGGFVALAECTRPWLLLVGAPALFAVHRTPLFGQLEHAARTDAKTGLLNAKAWQETATRELRRAARQNTPLGMLMVDLDHFSGLRSLRSAG